MCRLGVPALCLASCSASVLCLCPTSWKAFPSPASYFICKYMDPFVVSVCVLVSRTVETRLWFLPDVPPYASKDHTALFCDTTAVRASVEALLSSGSKSFPEALWSQAEPALWSPVYYLNYAAFSYLKMHVAGLRPSMQAIPVSL